MGDPFVRPGVACETYDDLVLRHPGTGHSETSMHEWMTQQHRDTLASLAGHHDRALLLSTVENVSVARMRFMLIDQLAGDPCGTAPKRARDQLHGVGPRVDNGSRPVPAADSNDVSSVTAEFAAYGDDDADYNPSGFGSYVPNGHHGIGH